MGTVLAQQQMSNAVRTSKVERLHFLFKTIQNYNKQNQYCTAAVFKTNMKVHVVCLSSSKLWDLSRFKETQNTKYDMQHLQRRGSKNVAVGDVMSIASPKKKHQEHCHEIAKTCWRQPLLISRQPKIEPVFSVLLDEFSEYYM